MATTSYNDIARAICLVSKDKTKSELPDLIANTVKFLARKRLISKAPTILENLNKIINKEEGKVMVRLVGAGKVKEETKREITHLLKKHYSAKEFIFIESVDERLLGGVRIEIENDVIDLSIKNKIGQLQEYLTKTV